MDFRPLRGLRPVTELTSRVASPPYDVPSAAEARRLAETEPLSFIRVVRAEATLAPETDPHDDAVYARARENLDKLLADGRIVQDERPAFYVYRQVMGDHVQTGILGAASVDDYQAGRIKRHEHTRPDKEDDRVRLNLTLGAHPGPVFLTYRDTPRLDRLVAEVTSQPPLVSFRAEGVEHSLWVCDQHEQCEQLRAGFADVPAGYVADGHHRSAAAARVARHLSSGEAGAASAGSSSYFLAAYFPATQLLVLDYNRVVRDLNGLTPDELLLRIGEAGFAVESGFSHKRPRRAGTFGMYLGGGRWYELAAGERQASSDIVGALDVQILGEHLLGPILSIGDPRTDQRIGFVGGIRGTEELERQVDQKEAAVAFAVYPTSLEDVMAVADAGRVMPPKSTWFEPKLRSGLVIQSLTGEL